MNFLQLWNEFCREEREKARVEKFRALTTEQLKAIWDAFDADAEEGQPGHFWPTDGPHIEDVHRILNERGEGKYCTV